MAPKCCGQAPHARKRAVLDGLRAAGIPLPDHAEVWGPSPDGWAWNIVDEHGHEPDPPIRSSLSLRLLEQSVDEAVHTYARAR